MFAASPAVSKMLVNKARIVIMFMLMVQRLSLRSFSLQSNFVFTTTKTIWLSCIANGDFIITHSRETWPTQPQGKQMFSLIFKTLLKPLANLFLFSKQTLCNIKLIMVIHLILTSSLFSGWTHPISTIRSPSPVETSHYLSILYCRKQQRNTCTEKRFTLKYTPFHKSIGTAKGWSSNCTATEFSTKVTRQCYVWSAYSLLIVETSLSKSTHITYMYA